MLPQDTDPKYALYRQAILDNCRLREPARFNTLRYEIEARHYEYPVVDLISRTVASLDKDLTALDLGCGHGTLSLYLNSLGLNVDAVDINTTNPPHNLFKERGIRFKQHDLTQEGDPFPDAHYDLIILVEVLEHLPVNPIPFLKRISKLLKPEGRLII